MFDVVYGFDIVCIWAKKISLLYLFMLNFDWITRVVRCSQYQLQSYFEFNHDQKRSTLLSQIFLSSNPALSSKSRAETSFTIVYLILFSLFQFFKKIPWKCGKRFDFKFCNRKNNLFFVGPSFQINHSSFHQRLYFVEFSTWILLSAIRRFVRKAKLLTRF